MTETIERRRRLQEARLRHRLAIQSRQIERTLAQQGAPAEVTGGWVDPAAVRYDVQGPLAQGWERVRSLTADLKTALGVPDVTVSRENGRFLLTVSRTTEPPVSLLDLLTMTPDVPPVTAVMGLSDNGRPVLLRFSARETTHMLLTGMPGAGKSALLRTMALSLALHNRQSQLQLLIIDPQIDEPSPGRAYLDPLNYLPHLITSVLYDMEAAANALQFLAGEVEYREENAATQPALVVLIDKADTFMEAGGAPVVEAITRLLQRGEKAGIHLVLSARQPDAAVFSAMLKAKLAVRVAGKLPDVQAARAATGHPASGADQLRGMGDFVAVTGQTTTYFQAAYVGDYDFHLSLQQLHRAPECVLLAQPYFSRPKIEPLTPQESLFQAGQMLFFDNRGKLLHDRPA
jgi:DNA segregation ATPase FtsK/SpoIIIE, S-DNA-T family